MGLKIAKFITGAILAQGIALGAGLGLVAIIPIRGTLLAMIVCPIGAVIVVSLTALAGYWAFGNFIDKALGGKG